MVPKFGVSLVLYRFGVAVSRLLGVNPVRFLRAIKTIPYILVDMVKYSHMTPRNGNFPIRFIDIYPCYGDRFDNAGVAKGHYFHQDMWAAKRIFSENPTIHVDIGSRIDGLISHLLVFREVTVVDVRPLQSAVPGLSFVQGDITRLEFAENSLESISCLHAIEHIGLGRYGDRLDYDGWRQGLREIERVLGPGGRLYLGTPIGRERLCFNAHRVFNPKTIREALSGLTLVSFYYVDDCGELHKGQSDFSDLPSLEYGCGLFEFVK